MPQCSPAADLSWCRELFPALKLDVDGHPAAFFDGPGGTQVPLEVLRAVEGYLTSANANAHGEFITSQRSDALVDDAREVVRRLLGGTDDHVVAFGANMTTLNFALARAVGQRLGPGDEVVVTDLDHEANRGPWLALAGRGVAVRSVPVVADECRLDMEALAAAIGPRTRLVAVGYASNAVGTVNDVKRITALAHGAGALVVVDAVHYVPHGAVDMVDLDCDFLLFSAYKLFGPHVGVLCGKREAFRGLRPDRVRCQKEAPPFNIETGTLNFEGIAGTAAGVRFVARLGGEAGAAAPTSSDEGGVGSGTGAPGVDAHASGTSGLPGRVPTRGELLAGMAAIAAAEGELGARLEAGLAAIPGVRLYGPPAGHPRTPTYSFTVRGASPRDVARALGAQGLFVWDGHFYAQTLVEALGLAAGGGLVRAGLAPYNTAAEVDRLVAAVAEVAVGAKVAAGAGAV